MQTNNKSNYWLFGKHAVLAALNNKKRKIFDILVTDQNKNLVKQHKYRIVSNDEIGKQIKSNNAPHQGIAALVSTIEQPLLDNIVENASNKPRSVIIALDQVTDPHNIGAIMRTAAAFNADCIIVPKHNSPEESATIAKTSSGAIEVLPLIRVTNLVSSLNYLQEQGYWVIGLDGQAKEDVSQLGRFEKLVIIMGAEGEGMRKLTMTNCDMLVKIPISNIESLNVSTATAIALYAASKQKV